MTCGDGEFRQEHRFLATSDLFYGLGEAGNSIHRHIGKQQQQTEHEDAKVVGKTFFSCNFLHWRHDRLRTAVVVLEATPLPHPTMNCV
eukprot:CAMPEP_0194495088 /NCGR_PEP_ID=MMETSP0253-20130528/12803_1 /TAXON_ID=2966 /ORGANISM="Noctiluca scintillans" /LENGTH=87 /DNA_ID=CAMNT_0039336295 /DNA_START=825 /DNA_END=1084 /DNA_ORIENTATION=+